MPPHLASAANLNHLWAALLVEELVRQGVALFVVCPGSRSTPLAVAVAQNPRARNVVHWDERAAGFVALGWGRATGRPAAVITTSGTAVANLLPAATEADADGVPLILVTADRPPELRETGANQTIRQPPIFQDVARWALDWPVPSADVPARWVLSTAAHAVHRALAPLGPVHLNLPFREPLAAVPDGTDVAAYLRGVEAWTAAGSASSGDPHPGPPFVQWSPSSASVSALPPSGPSEDAAPLGASARGWAHAPSGRGVIVVGDMAGEGAEGAGWATAVRALARTLGWPVLPDVRAPAAIRRTDAAAGAPVIANVDLVLASSAYRERQRPDQVLHLGGRIVSKRLARFLTDARPEHYVQVSAGIGRNDPDGIVTEVVRRPAAGYAADVERRTYSRDARVETTGGRARGTGEAWVQSWVQASAVAEEVVRTHLDAHDGLSEPAVARAIAASGAQVVAAASMPIRDLETFVPVGGPRLGDVIANRGASGIDGTIATAAGYARGDRRDVSVLIGDLALLHDQTSLALFRSGPAVVIVCVNNDGGGIFHRLPIASGAGAVAPDTFERFFGTPHGLGFEHAAAQVGIAYDAPATLEAFRAAVREAGARRLAGSTTLIEVRTDRAEQTALRAEIEAAVVEAVDQAGPPRGEP